jgi:hydroxypyruvate reductase
VAAGIAGMIPDTPNQDELLLDRAHGHVIANRQNALDGARSAAEARGYRVIVLPDPVMGEARQSAEQWYATVRRCRAATGGPLCVISAGETTVRIRGHGKGGRNQEFALAVARVMPAADDVSLVASIGTDGIDGPTDAAGAMVDGTTLVRAVRHGLGDPQSYLDQNDSFAFFEPLGDLIRTGRTDTNVGDLQVYLAV